MPKGKTWNIYIDLDLGMHLVLDFETAIGSRLDSAPQPVSVHKQSEKQRHQKNAI